MRAVSCVHFPGGMRLGRESGNIEDRRGISMGGVGLPLGGGVGGLILLLLISWVTGTNPLDLISTTSSVPQDQTVGTGGRFAPTAVVRRLL